MRLGAGFVAAASASKAVGQTDGRPTTLRLPASKRPFAAEAQVFSCQRPAADAGSSQPPIAKANPRATRKHKLYRLDGMNGCVVRLGLDAKVLKQMIKTSRAEKQFPSEVFAHLSRYQAWLDKLPPECMIDIPEVRGRLVRMHMLWFATDCEAEGVPVCFRNMNKSQLRLLSPDTAEFFFIIKCRSC